MKTSGFLNALLLLVFSVAYAETNTDLADYLIPANAVRMGPINTRDPDQQYVNFFAPDLPRSEKALLGRETYYKGKLIKLELFKDGMRHGVWKEWYRNGQLASEAPYRMGRQDGLFRHWSETGKLIGQYSILNGTGIRRIYNETGELVRDQVIEDDSPNGLSMEYFASNGIRSLVWMKNGDVVGMAFSFYSTGAVMEIYCYSNKGDPDGPALEFSPAGSVSMKSWYIHGRKVAETAYAAAAAHDPSLPAYHADASEYKQLVSAQVSALLEKYRTMPRVKIPLEFDQNGNPVPVSAP
jgi:antitoxin component YwqK of YwqJK toxin-antitoxin module